MYQILKIQKILVYLLKKFLKIYINKLQYTYGGIEIHKPHKLALQFIKFKYNINSINKYI